MEKVIVNGVEMTEDEYRASWYKKNEGYLARHERSMYRDQREAYEDAARLENDLAGEAAQGE